MRRCYSSLALLLAGSGLLALASQLTADAPPAQWPFNRLTRPAVPTVGDTASVVNAVDHFIRAPQEKAGIRPNPTADRATLLNRVTYDLTGLTPTAEEFEAFRNDSRSDAYERVVDRLLASPQFGERWAQHWLDLVRYAETDGFKLDHTRPDAWRYRDYVIRAFNSDLPYDRFLRQQLAGDELEPENPDARIATGFFRLHPEETNGANYKQIRQDILDDITDVFGSAVLGLTLGCARCHNHKFDPLKQKEYFQLQAYFAGILQRNDLPLVPTAEKEQYDRQLGAWQAATRGIRAEIDQLLRPVGTEVFQELVVTLDDESQDALKTPGEKRTPMQQQLALLAGKQIERRYARMYRRLPADRRARYDALQQQLATHDSLKPQPIPTAMGVCEVGPQPPATHQLANGNYLKPGPAVEPGTPACLEVEAVRPTPSPSSSGRRAALAAWVCRPDHPLTSRVIVNRLWQQYFGKGIVATPNDFGFTGERATHPALLDYLATELVRNRWQLKSIHRLIVTSATYQQDANPHDNPTEARAVQADPSNRLLWHARVRRRDAESIRDAMLQVAGRLNPRMGGVSALPELPPQVMESRYAWYPDARAVDRNRRSVYVYARRNLPFPLFAAFDAPDRVNSCPTRSATITAPQALTLLNSEFTMNQARFLAGRLLSRHGGDLKAVIRQAYIDVFGRQVAADEVAFDEQYVQRAAELIAAEDELDADLAPDPLPEGPTAPLALAVVDFCHALLNSAEFLYVE
ncbi:MAG: DUF1549 domain-containing protein [Planctomycetia bacterium]|nr:DUF1549 domain-containing protein [Planctomycetia bacterium]